MSDFARALAEAIQRDKYRSQFRPFMSRLGIQTPPIAPTPASWSSGPEPYAGDWSGVSNMVLGENQERLDRIKRPSIDPRVVEMLMKRREAEGAWREADAARDAGRAYSAADVLNALTPVNLFDSILDKKRKP